MNEYFEEYGDRIVGFGVMQEDGSVIQFQSGTVEEMYQAFKSRLLKELEDSVKDGGIRFIK